MRFEHMRNSALWCTERMPAISGLNYLNIMILTKNTLFSSHRGFNASADSVI